MLEFQRPLTERRPAVNSLISYALLGSYDFLHIFEAPDLKTAARAALLAQAFGAGTTETLTAISFDECSDILGDV